MCVCVCVCLCVCVRMCVCLKVAQSCRLCNPMDCGKNTGAGSLSLLQGFFPTQGSNPGLLHCREILYHLSHQGSPIHKISPNFCDLKQEYFFPHSVCESGICLGPLALSLSQADKLQCFLAIDMDVDMIQSRTSYWTEASIPCDLLTGGSMGSLTQNKTACFI